MRFRPTFTCLVISLSCVCFLGVTTADDVIRSQGLIPRTPVSKPTTISKPGFDSYLVVKFRDDLRARASFGAVSSHAGADMGSVESVGERHDLSYEQLIRLPRATLDSLEQRAAARSGVAQPDLAGMMRVRGPEQRLERAARELLALDEVEWVEFAMRDPEPPCSDIGTTTPDYFSLQGYHGPDPGLNMTHAWLLGARGQGIQIADCEYGYIDGTEDLCDITDEPGQTIHPDTIANGWDNHGTAVLGEMVGLDNAYGVKGLVPDASALFFPEKSVEEGSRRVTAITNAIDTVDVGDVVVLEMQTSTQGPGNYGPAELDINVWVVTKLGTDAGVIVVAAAGNGNQNLDSSPYEGYMSLADSGAIIVGAGTSNVAHDKLSFSTYGSRVNVQGWGQDVFTLGYGSYAEIDGDPRQRYTATFGGTSSATPFVASTVAALQSLAEQTFGCRYTPRRIRQLIIDTGIPQGSGGHIGPFPDLEAAAAEALARPDCVYPVCGNGIQEDPEECDGLDTGSCHGSCWIDCTCMPLTSGETTNLLVTDYYAGLSLLTISYDPTCVATANSLVYGHLGDVGQYRYTGQRCDIGNSGTYGPFGLGSASYFFMVVGHDGGVEGSYGTDSEGNERPYYAASACDLFQDLDERCD
jgi:subtilisin family serine protease